MKKTTIRIVGLLLVMALLAGCTVAGNQPPKTDDVQENQFDFGTLPTVGINWDVMDGEETDPEMPEDIVPVSLDNYRINTTTNVVANDADPVRYVMIYNPDVYDSRYPSLNTGRSTGNLGMQVEVDLNKGGLEEEGFTNMGLDQGKLNENVPFDELGGEEGSRYNYMIEPYQVGDTEIFYCYDEVSTDNPRIARTFTCRYAGTNCNIWVAGCDISDSLIDDYGTQFDTYIYPNVTETFGQPRFSQFGGKVNLLYYPLPDGLGGCFSFWDLYASEEVTFEEITTYGLNTDLDMLHINGNYTAYDQMQTFMRSTMAHEFQHLICATAAFETLNFTRCPVWINEAMSGYIEEVLYPGVKETGSSHMEVFRRSNFIRNGQSMYNFNNDYDDYGVYGSVYLYAQYLASVAGSDVFSNFHNYWRASYSDTLCDAEALAEACPLELKLALDSSVPYPNTMVFDTYYESFLSKLTLQFYLELLSKDDTDPEAFATIDGRDLLYNQINPASIEGGGRIIIALQGDSYTIPADADEGLIYVGLNADFEPVTDLIFR